MKKLRTAVYGAAGLYILHRIKKDGLLSRKRANYGALGAIAGASGGPQLENVVKNAYQRAVEMARSYRS